MHNWASISEIRYEKTSKFMNEQTLIKLLSKTPVTRLRYFDTINSTNDFAQDWINAGTPDFSIVVADQQTSGRGRLQRKWITNPGAALAFSVIFHLSPQELTSASLIPIMAAVSTTSAIFQQFSIQAQIKWPNDILVSGMKTAGILVESTWFDEENVSTVIGIGVNISPAALPSLDETALPATCLEHAAGHPLDRWQLLKCILISMQEWRMNINSEELIKYVNNRMAYIGQRVYINSSDGQSISGIVQGVDSTGSLLLQTQDGVESIHAGDVHLRLHNE